jgi:hypothetical protein
MKKNSLSVCMNVCVKVKSQKIIGCRRSIGPEVLYSEGTHRSSSAIFLGIPMGPQVLCFSGTPRSSSPIF